MNAEIEGKPEMESFEESREAVVDLFRPFADQGDPIDLNSSDPEVEKAETALEDWYQSVEESISSKENEQRQELDFLRTTIHFDAGFRGTDYLEELADDWLDQNLHNAKEAGFGDLATRISKKIEDINKI